MYILGYPLGLIMRLLYNLLHSYGWSLILFTLLIKLVMVPLSIKQQKSSAKIAAIQPQMQEIQKMYAKNQQKMNEEMQKLYEREKYNPAGGCLPMLITASIRRRPQSSLRYRQILRHIPPWELTLSTQFSRST